MSDDDDDKVANYSWDDPVLDVRGVICVWEWCGRPRINGMQRMTM